VRADELLTRFDDLVAALERIADAVEIISTGLGNPRPGPPDPELAETTTTA